MTIAVAFFLANEYLRAQGLPGLADEGKVGEVYASFHKIADEYFNATSKERDIDGLAKTMGITRS